MTHRKTPVRAAIRISAPRKWGLYLVSTGLWVSGCAWLVFHYFLRKAGEFGPEANPLEPWWLKTHGAFAFGALFMLGLLWGVHVLNGWASHRRRWSGGLLVALTLVLILSGYLLYYVAGEVARTLISLAHWMVGLGAPIFYIAHRFAVEPMKKPPVEGRTKTHPPTWGPT